MPTPSEVQAAVNRYKMLEQLRFKVSFDFKHTIDVVIASHRPVRNSVHRELSMLIFTLDPVIAIPGREHVLGVFYITQAGFEKFRASWAKEETDIMHLNRGKLFTTDTTQYVLFGAATEAAAAWFLQKLAQAQGMRFRSHGFLTPNGGKYVYAVNP